MPIDVLKEYMEHYLAERSHQGLDNQLIDGIPDGQSGQVVQREQLGGLLNYYYRRAA